MRSKDDESDVGKLGECSKGRKCRTVVLSSPQVTKY